MGTSTVKTVMVSGISISNVQIISYKGETFLRYEKTNFILMMKDGKSFMSQQDVEELIRLDSYKQLYEEHIRDLGISFDADGSFYIFQES